MRISHPQFAVIQICCCIVQSSTSWPKEKGNPKHKWTPSGGYNYLSEIEPMGEHCSMTERRADDATRDVADWLKCEYMLDHVGDEMDGVISVSHALVSLSILQFTSMV